MEYPCHIQTNESETIPRQASRVPCIVLSISEEDYPGLRFLRSNCVQVGGGVPLRMLGTAVYTIVLYAWFRVQFGHGSFDQRYTVGRKP